MSNSYCHSMWFGGTATWTVEEKRIIQTLIWSYKYEVGNNQNTGNKLTDWWA